MTNELKTRLRAAVLIAPEAPEVEGEAPLADAVTVDAAADIGNATTLVAVAQAGGRPLVWQAPTAKADLGLTLPARLAPDDTLLAHEDGVPVALGLTALRYSDAPVASRGSGDRYGVFTRDFVLAGVARLSRGRNVVVRQLAVTVPAEHIGRAPEVQAALRGRWRFELRGQARVVDVRRVLVVREGEAAHGGLACQGNSIIIDGGGGTTHVALARGQQLINVVTRATGYQRVLDVADDLFYRDHARRLTLLERYELELAMAAGAKDYRAFAGGQVDVMPYVGRARDRVAETIIADVKQIVPAWRKAETIWLVGGQAYHLRAQYEAAFPGIKVPAFPERANVLGALKLVEGV